MPIAIRRGTWSPAIRALGADEGCAAIGDVHGNDDLFAALLDAVADDLSVARVRIVVQLGDLVDRGPSSVAALRRAMAGLPGAESVVLMGNHEDRMLRAVLARDGREEAAWLDFGGRETIASAGVDPDAPDWREAFVDALGEELVDWLTDLPTSWRHGDIFFAHAGIEPAIPLARQSPHTLMWIRRPFLDSLGPYPESVAVIHGHTPQAAVDLSHPHRVNLDTGAFHTGLLSALVIVGERMRLVQAAR